MAERIRILIADDHYIVRQGLRAIIDSTDDLTVIAEAKNGAEAVAMFRENKPDVGIVDLKMPGMDGAGTIAAICAESPGARLIALSNYEGDRDIDRCLKAGARVYLLKKSLDEQLPDTIRAVHAGTATLPKEVQALLAAHADQPEISRREVEILSWVAKGKSNKEIASMLSLSVSTVNSHLVNILTKLGVDDRTEAATVALQRGILHLD